LQISFFQRCLEISSEKSALCIGLDPSPEILKTWSLAISPTGLREFSLAVVEAASKHVGFIKPQVGFYESFGSEGFSVLEELVQLARSKGLFVIADAKRGDIGSTMQGYSQAWLSKDSKLFSDALTVNGYLGISSLYESAEFAAQSGSGLFVLASTSNPEAGEIQTAKIADELLPQAVLRIARDCPTKNIGVVIGATRPLVDSGLGRILDEDSQIAILAPGFGAQGAKLSQIGEIFGRSAERVIASVSRSILSVGKGNLSQAILSSKNEL
jgi:orotidine-5'-phosphate decarboxylase